MMLTNKVYLETYYAYCTFGGQGTFLLVFPARSLSYRISPPRQRNVSLLSAHIRPSGAGRDGFKQCHFSIKITEQRVGNVCWEA